MRDFSEIAKMYNDGPCGTKYPGSKFLIDSRSCAHWWMGNDYSNASGYYGAYPPMYLRRIEGMFPYDEYKTLHLFSGSLPPGPYDRLDINPDNEAEICLSSIEIPHNGYESILADPPYLDADAVKYGYEMPNKKKTLESCHEALVPGGYLVWLDQQLPMFRKDMFSVEGFVSVIRSTNHRFRLSTIFRKV